MKSMKVTKVKKPASATKAMKAMKAQKGKDRFDLSAKHMRIVRHWVMNKYMEWLDDKDYNKSYGVRSPPFSSWLLDHM